MVKETPGNHTLTRQALRAAVYDCCPQLSRAKAREIFNVAFEEFSEALIRGEPVKLQGFGTFALRTKRERLGRNPKTGVEVPILPRRVMVFKPSAILKQRINSGEDVSEVT